MSIAENIEKIRKEIPKNVTLLAAAKTRNAEEIKEAIDAGITHIGENYVQEAEKIHEALGEDARRVHWHMIGHLQTNKINKALSIFDVIQTVDSLKKAQELNKRASALKRAISVYVEINIGSELSKSGLKPEYEVIKKVAVDISSLEWLKLDGIMTMGPLTATPEELRPYFKKTKEIFDSIRDFNLKNVSMRTLSMGMSNSFMVAIEEGSTMVRLGTILFGKRVSP
jgi:pyridoxal phosphate enzyme (YggS family)